MSATNRKAVVPLSRGGVEIDPESRRGVARQGPARRPVGRPLISAEKGLEMRPVSVPPCPDDAGKITPHPAPPFPYIFRTTVVRRRRRHVKPLKYMVSPTGFEPVLPP